MIGAGAFGVTTALRLAADGRAVTLLERKRDVVLGASKNNQNRLHLGFHYPRDLETARQCRAGFDRFVRMFPEAVAPSFPNQYFIASSGSRTSPSEYVRFLELAGLMYREIDAHGDGTVRDCSFGVLCDELVYDADVLRVTLRRRLDASEVVVRTDTEVVAIQRSGASYRLLTGDGRTEPFDAVVNCSYDEIERLTGQLGLRVREHQFEYTVIPIVSADLPRQGITIMDGPFMTLLPSGKTSNFLLYHVERTVVAVEHGAVHDPAWRDPVTAPFARMDRDAFYRDFVARCAEFVPVLRSAQLVGWLEGPRVVLAHRDADDARPSIVEEPCAGYVTVFAGKIDHCTWVADAVMERLAPVLA